MRLIDADAMHIDFDKYIEHIRLMKKGRIPKTEIAILLDCKGIINNAPTVDAVPVIRCKDCKHHYTDRCAMRYQYIDNQKVYLSSPMDFCSFGERKEE